MRTSWMSVALIVACGGSGPDGSADEATGTDSTASTENSASSSAASTSADTSTSSASTTAASTDGSDETGSTTGPEAVDGIWISVDEIMQLPTEGPAWDALVADANADAGQPNLSDQDQDNNVLVLAKAFVCTRLGDDAMCDEARAAVMAAIETENGGRTLALGRELLAYVIVADLLGLPEADDQQFRTWLADVIHEDLDGRTLVSTHEDRPNNWGTHAGASRVAAAIYLDDAQQLQRCADVFKGWLGDRDLYADFSYGELSWQADPDAPVGINPAGATKDGHDIDGVIPDDQRRGGTFTWPPPKENYVYEGLQGALAQAVILHRQGYDAFAWQDEALRRAFVWLHEQADFPAEGDDNWEPHIVNTYYGTDFPAPIPTQPGKNIGYTDWTHAP